MTDDTEASEIDATVSVEGHDLDEQQQQVVDLYEENVETFIRKNKDYGGSFENSAKLESILRHGEVRRDELFDIIAEQILVRGFYDKLSRFHQLQIQDGDDHVGESVDDTLLDMANYSVMLVAMRRKYEDESAQNTQIQDDVSPGIQHAMTKQTMTNEWTDDDVENFMQEHYDTDD